LQKYHLTTATPIGWYEDGTIAAVENNYGKGKTMLIGTFPGYGYACEQTEGSRAFFAQLLSWGGVTQHVTCSDPRLTARLHTGAGGTYLWITNPTPRSLPVRITISSKHGAFTKASLLWGAHQPALAGNTVDIIVDGLDAAVIHLE